MERESSPGRALAWALAVAVLLLVTVVLPAEYGIDWTGAGRVLGLTSMGEQKVAAHRSAGTPAAAPAVAAPGGAPAEYATAARRALRTDSIDVTIEPNAEVEYKAVLGDGDSMVYGWDAAGAKVTFDFHGEPAAGPQGAFLSFEKGSAASGAGTLRAPFAGTHGWYWKNATPSRVVIKLTVSGFHSELKRM